MWIIKMFALAAIAKGIFPEIIFRESVNINLARVGMIHDSSRRAVGPC